MGTSKDQLEFSFKDPAAPQGPCRAPGDFIRDELLKRSWSQSDLARILGRPLPTVNEIIQGKRAVMPEMAVALGKAFSTGAAIWAHREAAYRLSLVDQDDQEASLRAQLYEIAPISDMEKRGWLPESKDPAELELNLQRFFKIEDLANLQSSVRAAARQSLASDVFSPQQLAWLNQARRMAEVVNVRKFHRDQFKEATQAVRKLAGSVEKAGTVAASLAEVGVRLVVVEALPKSRIDGAVFWLDDQSPVVVLSLRFDRIDGFWFTLAHELAHIWNGDKASLDSDLVGDNRSAFLDVIEERADREGSAWLIADDDMQSFIARKGPYFSAESIHNFAKRMNVHAGVVTGQLQHRGAIDYKTHRGFLVKVRQGVTAGTMTDGWGIKADRYLP